MQYIAYIVTALSILGTVANSLQKRWCFIVWGFTNTFWCIFNIITGSYAQAILYAFNFAMAILGLIKWTRFEKQLADIEFTVEEKAAINKLYVSTEGIGDEDDAFIFNIRATDDT